MQSGIAPMRRDRRRLRNGAAVFGGSLAPIESVKNGKYIQYSRFFHTFAWNKISRRKSLPYYAGLPLLFPVKNVKL